MRNALKRFNNACMDCGRSHKKDGVRVKCHIVCFETADVAVLCADCREAQAAKAAKLGRWISDLIVVRDADPELRRSAAVLIQVENEYID